jgi:hypothetical protein
MVAQPLPVESDGLGHQTALVGLGYEGGCGTAVGELAAALMLESEGGMARDP